MLNTYKTDQQGITCRTVQNDSFVVAFWVAFTCSRWWKCIVVTIGEYLPLLVANAVRMWIQDVIWRVCNRPLQTHAENLRFHFHVYKLAFGFFPHGEPVAAAAEAAQPIPNLSPQRPPPLPPPGPHCPPPPPGGGGGDLSLNCFSWGGSSIFLTDLQSKC